MNSGSAPSQIAPWVAHIGSNPNVKGKEPHYITAEDARRQFAMLRAKNIGEILVWQNPDNVNVSWMDYFKTIRQVYTPMLQSCDVVEGSGSQVTAAALQYTLADPGTDKVIVAASDARVAAITVAFNGLWPNTSLPKLGTHLRLNLELTAEVEEMDASDRADLRVRAYVYKNSVSGWVPVPCSDPSPLSANEIGFYAPIADESCEMRRTLTIDHCVVEDDDLTVKVVVYSTSGETEFKVHFDLVQLYWADGPTPNCSGYVDLQGADANYSGTVTTADLSKFSADYLNLRTPADFNVDGVIDASDLAAFLAAYGQ